MVWEGSVECLGETTKMIGQSGRSPFRNSNSLYRVKRCEVSTLRRPDRLTFTNRVSYIYRTGVPLPSRCCILYIFSADVSSILNMLHTLRFYLQNAVYFIMLCFLVPVLFIFYIQGVLKFKCKTPVPKG
jgi:hypothetical protein